MTDAELAVEEILTVSVLSTPSSSRPWREDPCKSGVDVDVNKPLGEVDVEDAEEKESALRKRADKERFGSGCVGGGAVYTFLGEVCGEFCEEVVREGSGLGERDVDSIEGRLKGDGMMGVCWPCPGRGWISSRGEGGVGGIEE